MEMLEHGWFGRGDQRPLVLIRGGGDLGSGVALRLHRAGFHVAIAELEQPLMVRRAVAFGEAVYSGTHRVEEVQALRASGPEEAGEALANRHIPVLVDPDLSIARAICPDVIVDAIMNKLNTATTIRDAPLVIALGPGFEAGVDCHVVIETERGHWLGRVIWEGSAAPDSGEPGTLAGQSNTRVLRAPCDGILQGLREIGDRVESGEVVATVGGEPVYCRLAGVLRGLARSGLQVTRGLKIGDVDPRAEHAFCFTVSDKALAIGGGVLEAILSVWSRNGGPDSE